MGKSTTDTDRYGEECYGREARRSRSSFSGLPHSGSLSSIGEALYETGRWQSISVKFHRSSEKIHVVSVYGFPRANEGGEAMLENEIFTEQVFLEAESLGFGSVVIRADFNVKVENSPILTGALSSGSWTDAAEMFA